MNNNEQIFLDSYTGRWKYLTVRTIANFVYCKRKAVLELLFPKQVLKQKHVIVGKILHDVHYEIHKNGQDSVKNNLQQIMNDIKSKWKLHDELVIDEIKDKIERLLETHKGVIPNKSAKAEIPVSSRNGKIRGKIDLIIDGEIYEVKFPSKVFTKPFLNDILQAFIYGKLYRSEKHSEIKYVFIEYPLFGKIHRIDLANEMFSSIATKAIRELVEYSFMEELPPLNKRKKCEYCELRELCWSL